MLEVFADLCELTRNRPHAGDGGPAGDGANGAVHSPREYLHTYLHSLDVDRARLPQDFRVRLTRVLAHYGVAGTGPHRSLEEAVFRVFLAQQHTHAHVPAVSALLEPWLAEVTPKDGLARRSRDVLDRLVHATQLRYPGIGDLARSARHRWFEAPLTEAARDLVYAKVREQLHYLADHPGAADYEEQVEELVASPEPLVRFLAERLEQDVAAVEPMLEVLARRHYREYTLHNLASRRVGDRPMVTADYTLDDRPSHLISTVARMAELARIAELLDGEIDAAPPGHASVVDLYLDWPQAPADDEAAKTVLVETLSAVRVRRAVRVG